MSGKGSKPRPFSVDMKVYKNNWDVIFGSNPHTVIHDNTDTAKTENQDILSTEECILDALELDKK
jgi:hypothetical protein